MTDYTLHDWPIPFRGHFIRYVLAHVGATWDESPTDPAAQPYPFFAQPLLIDHADGTSLAQCPAILMYLGRKHGLIVDPDETLKLICDAMDVLGEITRANGAQMWDRSAWQSFTTTRLPRWMGLHERLAKARDVHRDAGFLFADTPTLADLTLSALWHTMVDRLPGLRPLLHAEAPTLEGLADRIATRPQIAAMLSTWQDGPRYCGGQIEASILEMLEG